MLDGTKAMRKTYPIQITSPWSDVYDYSIYLERYSGTETKLLAKGVSEDQIEALLSERDYQRFQDKGIYRFRVSGQKLADVLQVLV